MGDTEINNTILALKCWRGDIMNCDACAYQIVDPDNTYRCNLNKLHDDSIKYLNELMNVVHCKECKYSHMTYGGECKYCDKISAADDDGEYGEAMYVPGDFYCGFGERRQI